MNSLQVTDRSLFGERVQNKSTQCKCARCGTTERLRRIGETIMSNISHVLGLCNKCVQREAGL